MNGGPPTSLSAWGDFISRVGFPVVAALLLTWAVYHLSKSVTTIETILHNRDAIFARLDQGQHIGHDDLTRLDKEIQTLHGDHRMMGRRLDDLYSRLGMKVPPEHESEQ